MSARTTSHRAACIVVDAATRFAPGELRVRDGRVVSVGTYHGSAARVPPRLILPGLVNAHVHLQLGALPRARRQFLPWVSEVMRARCEETPSDALGRASAAIEVLLDEGVSAVGEIDSLGLTPEVLRSAPLAGVCYQELTGFHLGARAAKEFVGKRSLHGSRSCVGGLSPHAPYSVSKELFRAAARTGRRLAIHVAETPEELQFLREGRGPFRQLLERLNRWPPGFQAPGCGPVELLDRLRVLGPRTALIHAQHITAREAELVAQRRAPIVVCPGTIRYFRRKPPPVPEWLAQGIPVALGTDSVASNTELSMRHEMTLARAMWPALSDDDVVTMATSAGGVALANGGIGTLRRGAAASFLCVPCDGTIAAALAGLCRGDAEVEAVWHRGRRRRGRP